MHCAASRARDSARARQSVIQSRAPPRAPTAWLSHSGAVTRTDKRRGPREIGTVTPGQENPGCGSARAGTVTPRRKARCGSAGADTVTPQRDTAGCGSAGAGTVTPEIQEPGCGSAGAGTVTPLSYATVLVAGLHFCLIKCSIALSTYFLWKYVYCFPLWT